MIHPSADLVALLRAWHSLRVTPNGGTHKVSITSDLKQAHCAALDMRFSARVAVSPSQCLGEILRVASLASAPHVDPSVWNLLWWPQEDGLCVMDTSLCSRCDAMELWQAPIIKLTIRPCDKTLTIGAVLHAALYDWDPSQASDEFHQLCDTLSHPETDCTRVTPSMQLQLVVGGLDRPASLSSEARDLRALLAATKEKTQPPMKITRLWLNVRVRDTVALGGDDLVETVCDSGLPTVVAPIVHGACPGAYDTDTGLLWDLLMKSATVSVVALSTESFVDKGNRAVMLAEFLSSQCSALEELHLYLASVLPCPMRLPQGHDDRRRRNACEALGAALFAPSSTLKVNKLSLHTGALSETDMDAIERGAGTPEDGEPSPTERFCVVDWQINQTSEAVIVRFARRLSAVGVKCLRLHSPTASVSCHTLRCILEACPGLKSFSVLSLKCDDWTELAHGAWQPRLNSIEDLGLCIHEIGGVDGARVIDLLLKRFGAQLTRLSMLAVNNQDALSSSAPPVPTPFGSATAGLIITHCTRLRTLRITTSDRAFYEALTHAMDRNQCRIQTLMVCSPRWYTEVPWVPLLDTLAEPTRTASRVLKELHVIQRGGSEAKMTVFGLVETMARTNTTLRRIHYSVTPIESMEKRFAELPHQFAPRMLSLPRVLAFLSSSERLPRLPEDAVALVLAFAARPVRRYKCGTGASINCPQCIPATNSIRVP